MDQHRHLTGLPYDPVMVFPYGRFSSLAAKALKNAGFLAAFNSHIQAVDCEEVEESEYRRPYTEIYHGFPIFLRRYPKDKLKFADDIKNGRPIILVGHPGAFRRGYDGITNVIDWVNRQGAIKWRSLSYIAEYYGCKKSTPKGMHRNSSDIPRYIEACIRRFLCEIRDTYIDRSDLLANIYRRYFSPG
ncbi:MAG: hypothetical protein PHG91_10995 [Syntrophales bacterium]|nr:hypothetical protein [Syntrophales bacterium]MDD5532718.1 hypothetical protein [Syntrophales bacterium]